MTLPRMDLRITDISGPIETGMWHYGPPHFAPEIYELGTPAWKSKPVFSKAVRMSLMTGTYIESAAHVDELAPPVSKIPLDRTVLLASICVRVEVSPAGPIDRRELERAIDVVGPAETSGLGLLVSTGWDSHWAADDFLTGCPYFADEAMDLVCEAGFSLLGADTPRFENPAAPSGRLRTVFGKGVLLLAPLHNLAAIAPASGRLLAPPLPISGAPATPTRAIWIDGLD